MPPLRVQAVVEALAFDAQAIGQQPHVAQAGKERGGAPQGPRRLAVDEHAHHIALAKGELDRATSVHFQEGGVPAEELQRQVDTERGLEQEGHRGADLQVLGAVLQAPPVEVDGLAATERVPEAEVHIAGEDHAPGGSVRQHPEDAVDGAGASRVQEEVELGAFRGEQHVGLLSLGHEGQFPDAPVEGHDERFVVRIPGPDADVLMQVARRDACGALHHHAVDPHQRPEVHTNGGHQAIARGTQAVQPHRGERVAMVLRVAEQVVQHLHRAARRDGLAGVGALLEPRAAGHVVRNARPGEGGPPVVRTAVHGAAEGVVHQHAGVERGLQRALGPKGLRPGHGPGLGFGRRVEPFGAEGGFRHGSIRIDHQHGALGHRAQDGELAGGQQERTNARAPGRWGGIRHHVRQSMGARPWAWRISLVAEKWPQPMNPRWADKGLGCGAFRM